MAHPIMFDDADPVLARVREVALALPGAAEKISHGRPAFFTQKVFCYYGGSQRIDGERVPHDQAVVLLPDPDEAPALRQDPRFWVPAYLGPSGWLGLDLEEGGEGGEVGEGADWSEVAELVDASYRVTAPRRLVAELDARASG